MNGLSPGTNKGRNGGFGTGNTFTAFSPIGNLNINYDQVSFGN